MHLVRKFTLPTVMTLAVLAISATDTAAQGVTVTDEPNGLSCDIVVCSTAVHGTTPIAIRAHLTSGPEVALVACNSEFDVTVDGSGTGEITNQVIDGQGCLNKPCGATNPTSGDGNPWPVTTSASESGAHEFELNFDVCLATVSGGSQTFCELTVPVNQTEMTHQYELEGEGADGDGLTCDPTHYPPGTVRAYEFDSHWLTEDTNIEIQHAEGG